MTFLLLPTVTRLLKQMALERLARYRRKIPEADALIAGVA
jgi:hypothetical protein